MEDQYYKTSESVKEYIAAAQGFDGQRLIQKLHKFLPSGSTVLEIGSGPGTDFQLLKKAYSVVGSDFSEQFIAHLEKKNPNDLFLHLDAETLQTDKKFDAIYSNKVLQHLTNDGLKNSISRQKDILKPEGIICHSFWKGEGDEIFKGMLVNYQTSGSIKEMFQKDFKLLIPEEYAEFEEGDSLLVIGKKK